MADSQKQRRVTFYFDYISHNAYLAWWRLDALEKRFGIEFELIPVLFAGLLNAHGQLGPAEIRPKAWWMAKDVMRKAAILGIPLVPPASHPFKPLLALRVSSVDMAAGDRRKLVAAMFGATWGRGLDVSDPGVAAAATTRRFQALFRATTIHRGSAPAGERSICRTSSNPASS